MTADDTSRDALVERVALALCRATWEQRFPEAPWEQRLWDALPRYGQREYRNDAAAVVDAVVMPLVQERDAARAEALRVDEANTRMGLELTAARAEMEELQPHVMIDALYLGGERINGLQANLDAAIKRTEAAEAERDRLRADYRRLTSTLGYGDGINEPQADVGTLIRELERTASEASEWRDSQLWRNDCYDAGHPDDEDCWEHDPTLRLDAAIKRAEAAEAEVSEYRSAICFETTCLGCASLLNQLAQAEATHQALTDAVQAEADAYAQQPDVMEPCGAVAQALRFILDEHGAGS